MGKRVTLAGVGKSSGLEQTGECVLAVDSEEALKHVTSRVGPQLTGFMHDYWSLTKRTTSNIRIWFIDGKPVVKTVLKAIVEDSDPDHIYLNHISAIVRRAGFGTQVLRQITGLADKHGVNVRGFADADRNGPLSTPELHLWYQRCGFEVTGSYIVYRGKKARN